MEQVEPLRAEVVSLRERLKSTTAELEQVIVISRDVSLLVCRATCITLLMADTWNRVPVNRLT